MARMTGREMTTNEAARLKPLNSGVIRMELPRIARSGMMSMKMTMVAPMRLPTYISGSSLMMEFKPTESSPIEVKNPKVMKEIAKEETFSVRESRSTDLMAKPDPIQTPVNDRTYMIRLASMSS